MTTSRSLALYTAVVVPAYVLSGAVIIAWTVSHGEALGSQVTAWLVFGWPFLTVCLPAAAALTAVDRRLPASWAPKEARAALAALGAALFAASVALLLRDPRPLANPLLLAAGLPGALYGAMLRPVNRAV